MSYLTPHMLEAMLEALPGLVSWVSKDLTYLGVNPRLARVFKKTPEEFVGQPIGFVNANTPFISFCERLFSSHDIEQQAVDVFTEPGSDSARWYQFMGRKYDDGSRAVIVSLDVTEAHLAQQTISNQQAMIANAAKMAALGQMAGAIAHEINNPLSVILANAEVLRRNLKREPVDVEKCDQHAERVVSMSARISKIIRGCRAFARDATHDPYHKASLHQIFNDTLELCVGKFMKEKVKLQIPAIDDSIIIECRPTQISQVLINLINNSFDAVKTLSAPWVAVSVETDSMGVIIRVSDAGSGIDPSLCEEIFDPFFTTKPVGEGTGLGLSICREIVEDHQGTLEVDLSKPNTTFKLTLPYTRQEIAS